MYNNTRPKKRRFAWGCNVWGDSLCPSLTAFPKPKNGSLRLYGDPGLYDDLVKAFLGEAEDEEEMRAFNDSAGEIDEDLAREKWLSALFELEHNRIPDEELIKEHRLVAEKLGWIDSLAIREQNKHD